MRSSQFPISFFFFSLSAGGHGIHRPIKKSAKLHGFGSEYKSKVSIAIDWYNLSSLPALKVFFFLYYV